MNAKIKQYLKRTLIYKLYKRCVTYKKNIRFKADCLKLQEKGLETIKTFDYVMSNNGFNYYLAFGTLLGAIREQGFIKHDDDIDFIMWYKDYSEELITLLENAGFKLISSFSIDNDKFGKEDTFIHNGILVDIYYMYELNDFKYPCCTWYINQPNCHSRKHSVQKFGGLAVLRIELPLSHEIIRVPFYDTTLPVPKNYHEVLQCRYGNDYMTPIPGYKAPSTFVHRWDKMLGVYKEWK